MTTMTTVPETAADKVHCENCGLAVDLNDDGRWEHTDGYRACPPGFEAYASPENA